MLHSHQRHALNLTCSDSLQPSLELSLNKEKVLHMYTIFGCSFSHALLLLAINVHLEYVLNVDMGRQIVASNCVLFLAALALACHPFETLNVG